MLEEDDPATTHEEASSRGAARSDFQTQQRQQYERHQEQYRQRRDGRPPGAHGGGGNEYDYEYEYDDDEIELSANSSLIREATVGGSIAGGGAARDPGPVVVIPAPKAPVTPVRSHVPANHHHHHQQLYRDPVGRSTPVQQQQQQQQPFELSDPPSPTGRLADRISVLRQRCIEGLGEKIFHEAHKFLKYLQDAEEGDNGAGMEMGGENFNEYGQLLNGLDESSIDAKLRDIMGADKLHYSSLIDQVGGNKSRLHCLSCILLMYMTPLLACAREM